LASTWRCVAATVRECQRHTLRACRFAGLPIGARPPPSDTSHASWPTAARSIVIWFAPFEWAAVDWANVSVQSAIRSGGSCGVQRCVSNRATPADPAGCQTMNGMETLTQNGQSLAPSAANSNLKQISRQTRARPLPRALPALPSCASTVTTVANEVATTGRTCAGAHNLSNRLAASAATLPARFAHTGTAWTPFPETCGQLVGATG